MTPWLVVPAGLLALAAQAAAAVGIELRTKSVPPGAWVEVVPLVPAVPSRLLPWPIDEATIRVATAPVATLVCAGGMDVATACAPSVVPREGQVISISFAKGRGIVGRCLVGETPAAGAKVALLPAPLRGNRAFTVPLRNGAGGLERHVVTDGAGRFAIPPVGPGSYRLEFRMGGGRIHHPEPFVLEVPRAEREHDSRPLDLGDVLVPAGVSLAVRIANQDGLPVDKALVTATQGATLEESQWFQTRSADDGWAMLNGLGNGPLEIGCSAAGHVTTNRRYESVPTATECRLEEFASVLGALVDEAGKAVLGGTVAVAEARSITSSAGSFDLGELAPGAHRLQAAAPGYATTIVQLDLSPGEERALGDIRLLPGTPIEGRVVDAVDGQPIPDATVTVMEPEGAGGTVTDAEGRYRLVGSNHDSLRIAAVAAGYAPVTVSVTVTEGRLPPISLSMGGRISAVVWDEEADQPCVACTVLVQGAGIALQSLSTDNDGVATTGALPPGPYVVGLERVRSVGSLVLMQGGEAAKTVQVADGILAKVRFGEALGRIAVAFDVATPRDWVLTGRSASTTGTAPQQQDGSFSVRKPIDELVALRLGDGKGTEVQVAVLAASESRPSVVIALPKTRVSGVLHDGTGPAAHVLVQLATPLGSRAWATSDATGGFAMPFVEPGNYSLIVRGNAIRTVAVIPDRSTDVGSIDLQPPGSR